MSFNHFVYIKIYMIIFTLAKNMPTNSAWDSRYKLVAASQVVSFFMPIDLIEWSYSRYWFYIISLMY